MATAMKKSNTASTDNHSVDNENIVKKKKFSPDEEIPCVSLFPGEYYVEGGRSKDLYTFVALDDVQYIRYDDLDYMVKRKSPCLFLPRIIIQDSDFLELHPEIENIYSSMYSSTELKDILKLNPSRMKSKIESLPVGAKEALKTISMTEIDKGNLDSVNRIKILDEIFGTEMILKAVGN